MTIKDYGCKVLAVTCFPILFKGTAKWTIPLDTVDGSKATFLPIVGLETLCSSGPVGKAQWKYTISATI
jgi:hypothetical protein